MEFGKEVLQLEIDAEYRKRRRQMVSVRSVILSAVMLVGIVIIFSAVAGGNRVLLYCGLSVAGAGAILETIDLISRIRRTERGRDDR